MIISVEEAREILGKDGENMSDNEISRIVETLRSIAKQSIEETRRKILMRKDALAMADLTYDIYKEQQ
jgi:hypothetical protein